MVFSLNNGLEGFFIIGRTETGRWIVHTCICDFIVLGRGDTIGTTMPSLESKARSDQDITQGLLEHVSGIARSCGAGAAFIYLDALAACPVMIPNELGLKVFYVISEVNHHDLKEDGCAGMIRVPNVALTRIGQVKIAAFVALSRGWLTCGDRIVYLAGVATSGQLDTIVVTEVGREFQVFNMLDGQSPIPSHILPEVIERVVEVATEIGTEGREGKHVGTLFVIGDTDRVLPLTRQIILNPFKGYPAEQRNILDPAFEETIKEMATLDGAFVVRGDGVIETCGTYLKTASQEKFELPGGLGARHQAAAAITALTDSVAVTVSASTGSVMIFRGGGVVTEIEKPHSLTPRGK